MENNQIEFLDRKKSFEEWVNQRINATTVSEAIRSDSFARSLAYLRANNFPILEQLPPKKARFIASDFLSRKNSLKNISTKFFYECVYTLIAYAEFMEYVAEKGKEPKTEARKINKEHRKSEDLIIKEALTISYYLALREWKGLKELHYNSYKSAYDDISKRIGCRSDLLRDTKDEFDTYFDNGGYGEVHYTKRFVKVRNEVTASCKDMSEEELTKSVKNILKKYGWEDKNDILGLRENCAYSHAKSNDLVNVFKNVQKH